jgi:hypothetical protein
MDMAADDQNLCAHQPFFFFFCDKQLALVKLGKARGNSCV